MLSPVWAEGPGVGVVGGLFNRHVSRPALYLSTLHHRHAAIPTKSETRRDREDRNLSSQPLVVGRRRGAPPLTPLFIVMTMVNVYFGKG